jgi:hypothetical protein
VTLDLFSNLGYPQAPASGDEAACAALALACGHYRALGYPHRDPPQPGWFERYAESQGRLEAPQMLAALRRVPAEGRAAIIAAIAP